MGDVSYYMVHSTQQLQYEDKIPIGKPLACGYFVFKTHTGYFYAPFFFFIFISVSLDFESEKNIIRANRKLPALFGVRGGARGRKEIRVNRFKLIFTKFFPFAYVRGGAKEEGWGGEKARV